ncbi:nucleoside-diphosphate-sugar epimerase [Sulfitobacter undariae]|uniref:UDP-glucose 4-epimerase n=1 Tax=Sulfitobacter undariae TaxID=1563671 RepID=A0A7W6H2K6_9RHOB|nr:NAD(P)-dependent oxidoreductase [Sulfitobacter undariae]MBB3995913.1 nucleoside-diphosphate-sugar epimerase [Sulfitobacter undariae]
MKPIRVLVLGGSGRIGTLLRHAWAQDLERGRVKGIELVFQTRQAEPSHPDDLIWHVLGETPQAVRDAPPFDCMIVLSGITPKPDADFTLNTQIGAASLRAAADLGIGHVLLASTSAVYGSASDAPFAEIDPLEPVNDYGRSKLEMEQACQPQARALGVGLCSLRIGNVAGADALLMSGAALASHETLQLDCFEDGGTPVRSYIGPISLAQVMISLVRRRAQLPFALNIAAPHPVTMGALAEAAKMPVTLRPTQNNAHQHITLACDALSALHDFDQAESTADEILRQWQSLTGRA